MQIKVDKKSETKLLVHVIVDEARLKLAKEHAVQKLGKNVKVAGFREGKAPAQMIERAIDPSLLQTEFIDEALNHSFSDALNQEGIRPITQPKIELTKFVPFTTLEYTADVDILGPIKLASYKTLKRKRPEAKITADEIDQVITNLRRQMAEKTDVDREAQTGDQVWIDFEGNDEKGKPVNGASGKDYPLALGSNTFIPGFEDNLVGLKKDDKKTFTLTFPKDYGVKAMQGRKVTFTVVVNKVQEVAEPKLDDDFAKKVNPDLKTVKELREDIKKQLLVEKQRQTDNDFEAEVINLVADKSTVDLPESMVEQQAEAVMQELRQNLTYRGLTFQEYLENYGLTEEEQREKEIIPEAKRRLKAGLVLSEIAEKENLSVTPEEVEIRIQVLKQQYKNDQNMLAELDKEENRRDVAARLLTEKTIKKLVEYVES